MRGTVGWWEVCQMSDDYADDEYDTEDDLYSDPLYEDGPYGTDSPEESDEEDDESEYSPFPTAFYGFVAMIMGEHWDS